MSPKHYFSLWQVDTFPSDATPRALLILYSFLVISDRSEVISDGSEVLCATFDCKEVSAGLTRS